MLMFFVKTDSHRTFEESQNVCPVQNVLIYNKQKQTNNALKEKQQE